MTINTYFKARSFLTAYDSPNENFLIKRHKTLDKPIFT